MTPEERSDLAALHALSLLEGDDAALAAQLMANDPEFAAEVEAFSETSAILADATPPVPPSALLRERVISLTGKPQRRVSWIGWAAAAAILIAALTIQRNSGHSARILMAEIDKLQTRATALQDELDTLRHENQIANLHIASLEGQIDEYKGTRAVVIWDTVRREGMIRLTDLPPVPAGHDYQLWIVDPAHEHPVSGGLIHRDDHGSAVVPFQPVEIIHEATAFAISIEQAGGVDVGVGPIVFLGK